MLARRSGRIRDEERAARRLRFVGHERASLGHARQEEHLGVAHDAPTSLTNPSVHELGFVKAVGAVMRDADVLLLPSVTEGSALVTYEAQAAGCALLVSAAAGAPCVHLEEGLVHEPGDIATLTEHVRRVDRDRKLLGQMKERALQCGGLDVGGGR